jgi:hypothetical protein
VSSLPNFSLELESNSINSSEVYVSFAGIRIILYYRPVPELPEEEPVPTVDVDPAPPEVGICRDLAPTFIARFLRASSDCSVTPSSSIAPAAVAPVPPEATIVAGVGAVAGAGAGAGAAAGGVYTGVWTGAGLDGLPLPNTIPIEYIPTSGIIGLGRLLFIGSILYFL